VISITVSVYSDLIGSGYQQDVNLLQLYSDVKVYNNMIIAPEQAEMLVDTACRAALSQRGVGHLTIPIDIQEKKLDGKYSMHKVPGHTSDVFNGTTTIPDHQLIQQFWKQSRNSCILIIFQNLDKQEEFK
jgi:pyruvate dehydrogenase (quinone)